MREVDTNVDHSSVHEEGEFAMYIMWCFKWHAFRTWNPLTRGNLWYWTLESNIVFSGWLDHSLFLG